MKSAVKPTPSFDWDALHKAAHAAQQLEDPDQVAKDLGGFNVFMYARDNQVSIETAKCRITRMKGNGILRNCVRSGRSRSTCR